MKVYKLFVAACLLLTLAACSQNGRGSARSTEQDVRLAPGEYVTDEPEDIVAYFEALCRERGAVVAVHSDEAEDLLEIWNVVRSLDDYAAGRRVYYPAEEVRHALDALAFDLGYWFSHGCETDTNHAEVFFFRFLEQAVRLSPKVDYVTDFHSADGTAGILNFHEWSPNPLYSFLVYPTNEGLRVRLVGQVGNIKIEKLFHLTDSIGREYYLCSNNGDFGDEDYFSRLFFCQYLFMCEENAMVEVVSDANVVWPTEELPDNSRVVFNPRLLRWDGCRRDGDKYVPLEGFQPLLLHLDGRKSRFEIE